MKKRLISGIQPSGVMHIGNYFGAIKQFVDLQNEYDSYIFIADLHALTTVKDKEVLSKNILNIAMDYLACGLDPKKVCLYKQSDIPEVTELTWYFNTITTMPFLERATSYKDAHMKSKEINVGLFDYPILMASDILIQDALIVPVGQDQKQHIEYTRDIAQKFNKIYGDSFMLPKELILDNVSIVPGIDGRKMSKSYNNTIPLFSTNEEIKKIVMKIVTDSKRPEEKKDPDSCNIFSLYKLFANKKEIEELKGKYIKGGLGYKEAKELLLEKIISFITPLREKRKFYENNKDLVLKILKNGAVKARENASKKIDFIRNQVGVNI